MRVLRIWLSNLLQKAANRVRPKLRIHKLKEERGRIPTILALSKKGEAVSQTELKWHCTSPLTIAATDQHSNIWVLIGRSIPASGSGGLDLSASGPLSSSAPESEQSQERPL